MIGALGLKTFSLSYYSFKTGPTVMKKDGYKVRHSSDGFIKFDEAALEVFWNPRMFSLNFDKRLS